MPDAAAIEEQLLGPVAAGRECGTCVACCEALRIRSDGLDKPHDVLCSFNSGTGCTIHETRPHVCRAWFCAWRRIASMPDHLRPDRSGVIYWLKVDMEAENPFARVALIGWVLKRDPPLGDEDALASASGFMHGIGRSIWLSRGGKARLVFPGDELHDAIVDPGSAPDEDLAATAMAWRRALRMDVPAP